MEDFVVKLADVAVRIKCRYKRNHVFLQDYLSDQEPCFTVNPMKEDLAWIRKGFFQMAETEEDLALDYDNWFLENNAIHALLAEKLVEYNTLLFHGSALCMDGQAYIFTAPSGTGKSTHTGLWREVFGERVQMINDDKPLLRIEDASTFVYGSPWAGKYHLSQNTSAPLKAIVKLERSPENRIMPMEKAEAFPVLIRHAIQSQNPAVMARIMELEKLLLDTVSFYSLRCNMEPEAAEVAWEGMAKAKEEITRKEVD